MRNLDYLLKNKKIDYNKLIEYGFIKKDNAYCYQKEICNKEFLVDVFVNENKQISRLVELENNEDYVLVDTNSKGNYVGKIREEYENILNDIANNCFIKEVFKNKQTKEIINYIKDKYNNELEFLWEKFDNNAIVRRIDNKKWYGLFGIISLDKLGIDSHKEVEILNVRCDNIENVVDNKTIFLGYHMNKKHWITIILNNNMSTKDIINLLDKSYNLANRRK